METWRKEKENSGGFEKKGVIGYHRGGRGGFDSKGRWVSGNVLNRRTPRWGKGSGGEGSPMNRLSGKRDINFREAEPVLPGNWGGNNDSIQFALGEEGAHRGKKKRNQGEVQSVGWVPIKLYHIHGSEKKKETTDQLSGV